MQGGPYTAEELFEQVAQAGAVAYKGCGAARFDFFDAPCLKTTISKALSCATIAGAVILELPYMPEIASAGSPAEKLSEQVAQASAVAYKGCGATIAGAVTLELPRMLR